MKKSLFAATFAASLFTLSAPQTARAQLPTGAWGTGGYSDGYGSTWNNGTSAIFSSMTNGYAAGAYNRQLVRRSLANGDAGQGSGDGDSVEAIEARGVRVIRAGRATNRFPMRPFPIGEAMQTYWNGDAQTRKKNYSEYLAQSRLWREEVAARGTQLGDYGQMMALEFVMCVEAFSGRRVNNAGFQARAADLRRLYLKSPDFQGRTVALKQKIFEKSMMRSSYALYLRRTGNVVQAREVAAKWLAENWDTDHPGVSDADDAVNSLARYSSTRVARQPMRRVAPSGKTLDIPERAAPSPVAPPLTLAQANILVRYKPAASSVLPALLVKGKAKSADELKLYETLLDAGRAQMRQLFSPAPNGQEDVGDAFTYAVMAMVSTAKSKAGNLGEAGFNPQNSQELGNRLTLMLASNPAFAKQSARQKQQMAETAILLATIVGAMNGQAQKSGDAKMRARAVELAGQSLQRLLGVSLGQVQVTPTEVVFAS